MTNDVIIVKGNLEQVQAQVREAYLRDRTIEKVRTAENVILVLQDLDTLETHIRFGHNIVTNAGDTYYAQRGAAESPTNTWSHMRLGNTVTAPTKADTDVTGFVGTGKAIASGYPKSNDSDTSNTGRLVDAVSWKADWATGDNNVQMQEGAIGNSATAPTASLCHFLFTQFTKTSAQTLAVYVNHEMRGV